MYLSYYKLNKKPFQISTDPNFFWLGEKHKEALSTLKYGVMDDKGFLLLTGDVGTGKTTLINAFVNSLGDDVIISRVSDPGLTQLDFIHYIAKMFKIATEFKTKSEFLILFSEFLLQADRDDKKVLLIIDEAQHLTEETLEEIRLLSNIEKQDKKLLNIFLVGQSEFNKTLEKYQNRALRQRLTLNYTLYPLEAEETKACIEFRLNVAGAKDEIFTPEAIEAVHSMSCGFPRVINIICDHALRLGYQEGKKSISAAIITQCSKTLHAVHLHQSHQHDGHFTSNNEWLEESEVPPLSPEAIDRISQPLPEFVLDNEVEIKEQTRSHSITVPLLLAALFISGFFLLKNDNLTIISDFIMSLKKSTITAIKNNDPDITDSQEDIPQPKLPMPSETVQTLEGSITPPIIITKKQIKQKIDHQANNQPVTDETPRDDENTSANKLQTLEAQPETSLLKHETAENETAGIKKELKNNFPTPIGLETTEGTKISETSSTDIFKEQYSNSEVISDPPISAVNNSQYSSVPEKKTTSPNTEPTIVQIKVRPETPPSPPKASTNANDDPGAVIDWLLKSKN